MEAKILQVKRLPIFDCFFGEGWETWTRVLVKNGKLIILSGMFINPKQMQQIKQHITKVLNAEREKDVTKPA